MKLLLGFFLLFLVFFTSNSYAQFKVNPCYAKEQFASPDIPGETEIINVAGHVFRKKDGCVVLDIKVKWQIQYKSFDHTFYNATITQNLPGEFWYRVDRNEFAINASPQFYKGIDKVFQASGHGESCAHTANDKCDKWYEYPSNTLTIRKMMGSNFGSFLYGFPKTVLDGEDVEEQLYISMAGFEFVKDADNTWSPDLPEINYMNRKMFDYKEFVLAAVEKRLLKKELEFNHDNDDEDSPTDFKGKVTISFIFDPPCPDTFKIINPKRHQKFLFSKDKPSELSFDAEVGDFGNFPTEYLNEVIWDVPKKDGSNLSITPENAQGRLINVKYEGLPHYNTDMGDTTLKATVFLGSRCGEKTDSVDVKLFFPRDAKNNRTPNPNWYYYWQQTKAGHNTVADVDIKYMHRDDGCATPQWLGYYPWDEVIKKYTSPNGTELSQTFLLGRNYIYICDFSKYNTAPNDHFPMYGVIDSDFFEGIDTFGVIVKHELTHRKHHQDWWIPRGGYSITGWYDLNKNGVIDNGEMIDKDKDFIPDAIETTLGMGFDTSKYLTDQRYAQYSFMHDEHHLTYYIGEKKWKLGDANDEDWSFPGAQWRE